MRLLTIDDFQFLSVIIHQVKRPAFESRKGSVLIVKLGDRPMRRLLLVLLSLAIVASARGEAARLAPPAGAKLTYRLITTTTRKGGDKTVAGQVHTDSIIASDGYLADGTITLDGMLFACKNKPGDPLCDRVLRAPGARADGEMIFVPIPAELNSILSKDTALRLRYFVVEKRVAWLPATGVGDALFSPNDPLQMTNEMDCDHDGLRGFRPLGDARHVALICTMRMTRAGGAALGMKPVSSTQGAKLDVVDLGPDTIDLPSGVWEVRRLKLNFVTSDGGINAEGEASFSEKLGVAVRTRWTHTLPSGTVSEAESELIAVSP
jgi:hypothetical protein